MGKQLDSFKTSLEDFAGKYKQEIRKNPEFRGHFQQMCARIGVDPAGIVKEGLDHFSSKGFLGRAAWCGDFYYELGVQIVEICMATRSRNGGLMALDELHKKILKTSKSRQDVSEDDLARAIKKLPRDGSGFQILPVGNKRLVQSVPGELNMDHTAALQLAQGNGYTSVSAIMKDLGWQVDRTMRVLDHMVMRRWPG
ncbi:ESCRT-II subunit protein snf8 [Desmophyllum pertusum]|uniref:Vacuolar-sorting protein SNF8 n=1 Tax=Desmophyllum pertusum TaxID=174260 RepID=A0A9X0A1N2_9CNID|nr:ESCRT-II subunit protein snf8 [Desmophyllum pertusum]